MGSCTKLPGEAYGFLAGSVILFIVLWSVLEAIRAMALSPLLFPMAKRLDGRHMSVDSAIRRPCSNSQAASHTRKFLQEPAGNQHSERRTWFDKYPRGAARGYAEKSVTAWIKRQIERTWQDNVRLGQRLGQRFQ
jgi:hypothetical protein